MNLNELKKELPYKWRLQSCSKYRAECSCVAYIDSRQVQDLLDEVIGVENWQCSYKEVKGNLFCSIGIFINNQWIWKEDCGTESNMDKEKGEASDSFKRAAVKWGIGRFLYNIKLVTLPTNEMKKNDNFPYPVTESGKRIYDLTKYINENILKKTIQTNPGKISEGERQEMVKRLKSASNAHKWADIIAEYQKKYPYLENDENFQKFVLSLKPKQEMVSGESIADEMIKAGK